jgi:DNA helicase II / ATP-dependent DNA helicase PcrA
MTLLNELNSQQADAARYTEGPLLVLAGAGTGKTRVITYRIAHLVQQGVSPSAILGVTFTNKAAEQMQQRITGLLRSTGNDPSGIWLCTFHSLCARLIRRESAALNLPRDFAIYDDSDQTEVVKHTLAELQLDDKEFPPRAVLSRISYAKNHGIDPRDLKLEARGKADKDMAKIYELYLARLRKANALDFDDLLLRGVELLKHHPEVRARWNERFHYILVDEFQDTNRWQEELVKLLAGARRNVCVVGDEDQSIYSWRGAKSGSFQRFLKDFPDARTFRLEKNYRSTQNILDASGGLVAKNTGRLGKNLRAAGEAGSLIKFFEANDSSLEAEYVCREIRNLLDDEPKAHIAVLYRTTAQSRSFEEVLRRMAIRYRVVGGFSFYKRAEIKAALSYLRLAFHPEDDVALLRVLNTPPRGIGKTTIDALRASAQARGITLWDALIGEDAATLKSRGALRAFRELIESVQPTAASVPPAELMRDILNRTNYIDWIEQQDRTEHTTHAENVRELVNAIAEATERGETLDIILDRAALVAMSDDYDEEVTVSLMTLHSAKGLEFDAVFLAGLEEGVLPHSRSQDQPEDIEEERRLCYVGMTRARKSLTISRAQYRRTYGEERLRASMPSRFLREIPLELMETVTGSLGEPGEVRRYEPVEGYSSYRSMPRRNAPSSGGSSHSSSSGAAYAPARGSSASRRASNPMIGRRVRHPTLGVGTILAVDGDEEDRTITVSFQDHGTKKLKEAYANLSFA